MILRVPEQTSLLSRSCLPAGPEQFKSHSSVPKFGAQFAYVAWSLREYLAQHIVTQQVPSTERYSLTDCVCAQFFPPPAIVVTLTAHLSRKQFVFYKFECYKLLCNMFK